MTAKLGLTGLALLGIFIFGQFYLQLAGGPSRTQTARLDPFGDINIHLETTPDPPKTGNIPLILHITDANGKPVAVDKVQYEYAFEDQGIHDVQGKAMGDGNFQAVAALTDVGEWQVRVTLYKGNQQTQVKFVLRVMANI